MAWLLLSVAGLLEVVWAVGLKLTCGFTRPVPTLVTVVALAGSLVCLALALRSLPLGTAYAIWVGIGAIGVAAAGLLVFGESASPARLASLVLVIGGVVGLKLAG